VAPSAVVAQDVVNGKITDTGLGRCHFLGVNVVIKELLRVLLRFFDGNDEISVDIFPTTLVFSNWDMPQEDASGQGTHCWNVALEESATGRGKK